jgi:hypothetical protein
MTKNSTKLKVGKHTKRGPSGPVVVREYARTLAKLRRVAAGEQGQDRYDDLPSVRIAPPAVRPTDVRPEQIRKAVRKAVQEFSERHGKALARS